MSLRKPNRKLIIRNYTDLPDLYVLEKVYYVVQNGQISETSKGKQYCFTSLFKDYIVVSVHKSGPNTETFYIYKDNDNLRVDDNN